MAGRGHTGSKISADRSGRHHCYAHEKKSVRFSGGRII